MSIYHAVLPALGLILWTFVMWIWMFATRIPAMQNAKINPESAKHPGTTFEGMPSNVRAVADNYNHLHEQPVLFYALTILSAVADLSAPTFIVLAWFYVASRVVHSLIQATVNIVMLRFLIFILGSFILLAMAIVTLMAILPQI